MGGVAIMLRSQVSNGERVGDLANMSNNNSRQRRPNEKGNSALGFEATLWATADKLRGNLDAAEYKHVVLGLIFLKYISDAFEERHAELQKEKGADPEDRDEYTADNIFWVPPEARWSYLQGRAKDPSSASCSTAP